MSNSIVISFLNWFFMVEPVLILRAGRNFLFWGWHFFSIGYLLPRLLSPWHRDITSYGRGFDLKRFLHVFGWNLISRIIGAFLRIFVILIGIFVELIIIILTIFSFLFWYVLPLLAFLLIIFGIVTYLTAGL